MMILVGINCLVVTKFSIEGSVTTLDLVNIQRTALFYKLHGNTGLK